MPIVHMTNDPARVPPNAVNVKDVSDQWREYCAEEHRAKFKLYTWESHHGLCLEERERNMYHDSDFYMVVWDPEAQQPKQIEFATTRGWSYPCLASAVDATPEVRAAYESYLEHVRHQAVVRADIEQAKRIDWGRDVKVVRGRKVPVGTTGDVFWLGSGPYGGRIGIRTPEGERVFVAAKNCEVVNPDRYRRHTKEHTQ